MHATSLELMKKHGPNMVEMVLEHAQQAMTERICNVDDVADRRDTLDGAWHTIQSVQMAMDGDGDALQRLLKDESGGYASLLQAMFEEEFAVMEYIEKNLA